MENFDGDWELSGTSLGNSGTSLGIVWDMFGNCLELSTTDNQYINQKNGTKSGTCLGSVYKLTIN